MAVFAETPAIPERVIHDIEGRILGTEREREGSKDITRELESTLIMKLDTARTIRNWLDGKIKSGEKLLEEIASVRNLEGNHGNTD